MDGILLLALLLAASGTPAGAKEEAKKPAAERGLAGAAAMRGDARLSDIWFFGPQRGWAVGDRGAIWHTEDGGRRWIAQESGVDCPLESVSFIDENTGWAVGGATHPYTHTSYGVVLVTRDGGAHWQHNPKLLLPGLKRVRFLDPQHGWAAGSASAMFPGGVFTTDTGGQSWLPLGSDESPGWVAADFVNARGGAAASRSGAITTMQQGRAVGQSINAGLRNVRQIKFSSARTAWLAGDGGLILTSNDMGATWQPPPGTIPEEIAAQFDFYALAARGSRIWIAGAPGTRVFHSDDAGKTWTSFPTGSRLPIHALCFCDDEHGWAVGALGLILATEDGGRSWRRQRSGSDRAAVLGLLSQVEDVPLELFARLSGNNGYLGVVEALNRCDPAMDSPGKADAADRLREALMAVGGSDALVAWQFPVRHPDVQWSARQILDLWDRATGAHGSEALEAHIVRQIRMWQPEIVVTHDAYPRGDEPLRHLINQIVAQAVRSAGDPAYHAGQFARIGLEPWQVKKVYAAVPPPAQGSTDLTTAQLATRLGRSLAEVAAMPRGLLEDRFQLAPPTLGFRLLINALPQEQGQRDFMAGILLQPGSESRRESLDPPAENLDLLRRVAEKRRNVQAILDKSNKTPQGGAQLLGQAGEMILGMDSDSAGQILYQLADRYYRSGMWDLAADTLAMLITRYPDHPLTRPALIWLVQYFSSDEAAWRGHSALRTANQQASVAQPPKVAQSPSAGKLNSAQPGVAVLQADNRIERAIALGKSIEQNVPDLYAEAAVRFPLAAANRGKKAARPVDAVRESQSLPVQFDVWRACAQGELWLAEQKGPPPKPVLICIKAAQPRAAVPQAVAQPPSAGEKTTSSKPRLDGKLDDELWKQAKSAPLQSSLLDDDGWPAAVMLAYDSEFLYIAVTCREAPGAKYEPAVGTRTRDADLSTRDRVEIFLDVDRDYAVFNHLSVDYRGWATEDCWGDPTWNPTWHVAAARENGTWTIEAAIPFDQLTGASPRPKDAWALGIQRIVPGVGFQSWTTPSGPKVRPEGFGYLVFE
jgi:photosystem II stability/assembly factor-like uncharacterized protein